MPAGYSLRRQRQSDDADLVRVENRAVELFRDFGYGSVADHPIPDVEWLGRLIGGRDAWVAADPNDVPVGFAVAGNLGDYFHLYELSVDPAHGRRGLGTALVAEVVERGRQLGKRAVSLTTFRDVPFNAPFYARLGFVPFTDRTPTYLIDLALRETPEGVSPATRVLMVKWL